MNLNTATLRDLQQLPGVGNVTAQCIVESRPFSSVVDLLQVKGIGPVKFAAITAKNQIYVGDKSSEIDVKNNLEPAFPKVDLNSASKRQLQQLNGVGPALAQRIIDARPFFRAEDVLTVKGIGTKSFVNVQVGSYVKRCADIIKAGESGDAADNDGEGVKSNANFHICMEIENDVRGTVAHTLKNPRDDNRTLLIASWNIRNISRRKKVFLLQRIATVLDEFDIVALQEVRDLLVLKRLKTMMPGWDYVVSETVGRKTSESSVRVERYAFFYRRCAVRLIENCSLIEDSSNVLARLPCVASFQTTEMPGVPKLDLALINVHVSFSAKTNRQAEIVEINRLATEMSAAASDKRVIVLGDFNLSPQDALNSDKSPNLVLIRSPLSTTVFNKLYDNIWIYRPDFSCCNDDESKYVINSGVFRIDWKFYPLSKSSRLSAKSVRNPAMPPRLKAYMSRVQCSHELSDHCPVWVAFTVASRLNDDVDGGAT